MDKFKVVVMGPGGVGKTALILQFVSGHFLTDYDPTIEDFYTKEVYVDGSPTALEILDTAGQEQYAAMRERYIQNGDGFILIYSITSEDSLSTIRQIKGQIEKIKHEFSPPILLVGNMCDMEEKRNVGTHDGKMLAREWGCPFLETSAKTYCNVQDIFQEIVRERKRKETRLKDSQRKETRLKDCHCVCL